MDQTMTTTEMVTSQKVGVGPRWGLSWGGGGRGAYALCLGLLPHQDTLKRRMQRTERVNVKREPTFHHSSLVGEIPRLLRALQYSLANSLTIFSHKSVVLYPLLVCLLCGLCILCNLRQDDNHMILRPTQRNLLLFLFVLFLFSFIKTKEGCQA